MAVSDVAVALVLTRRQRRHNDRGPLRRRRRHEQRNDVQRYHNISLFLLATTMSKKLW